MQQAKRVVRRNREVLHKLRELVESSCLRETRVTSSIQTTVYQKTNYNLPRAPTQLGPQRTQNLPSVDVTCTQLPLQQTMNSMQNYCMLVGFSQGDTIRFPPNGTQNLVLMAMTSTQAPQPPPRTVELNQRMLAGPQENGRPTLSGNSGDLTACKMHNTSSSFSQEVAVANAHSSMKPTDTIQKRELRLLKNREAARECRRKKKEYVKCLENRVAVLENQNKTLIEELRALKDIYRHKVE